jgi:hydroxymethylbilane synthase
LFSLDGKEKIEVDKVVPIEEWKKLGFFSAQEVLNNGGTKLMMEIKTI